MGWTVAPTPNFSIRPVTFIDDASSGPGGQSRLFTGIASLVMSAFLGLLIAAMVWLSAPDLDSLTILTGIVLIGIAGFSAIVGLSDLSDFFRRRTHVHIGNNMVRLLDQNFPWSDFQRLDLPLSEFAIRIVDDKSGPFSGNWSVDLVHLDGRKISLFRSKSGKKPAVEVASDVAHALGIPLEPIK